MYNNLGVTIYLDDIHVVQFEKMDNVNKADYDYFLQVRDVENINLNGYSEIDIYTKGEKR